MSGYLKRLRAPGFWKVPKKERKWVVKPRPGPHKTFESIPLLILVRNVLKLVDTGYDARKIIKSKEIMVDGKPRRDHKYPVGLMDVIEFKKMKKTYRVISIKKGLDLIEIPNSEAKLKLCRINNKKTLRGGHVQLNLHDGKNVKVKIKDAKTPKKDVYKTGDSILLEFPEQKIADHVQMKEGNIVMITGGQNKGKVAKLKKIITTRSREPNKVTCEEKGKEFDTIKDFAFPVGKIKPLIKIGEK